MKKNILQIFIASPGDLNNERKEARLICQRVNKTLSRTTDWQVELLGWEDTLPSANRPQELINQDVAMCELFIGLLWKRWGQNTGEYDSGFFEEYTIAKKNRKDTSKPEIWLFFKDINENELLDPGPQLTKVIDFKRKIENEKEILYKNFKDEKEFSIELHDYLIQYILKLNNSQTKDEDLMNQSWKTEKKHDRLKTKEVYSKDVVKILDDTSEQDELLKTINLNRINLFTSLIINNFQGDHSIDNHVLNRVYLGRIEYELSSYEIEGILQYLLNSKYHPGWYWLRSYSAKKIYSLIRKISIEGTIKQKRNAIQAALRYGIDLDIENNIDVYFDEKIVNDILPMVEDEGLIELLIERYRNSNDGKIKKKIQILEFEQKQKKSKLDAVNYLISNVDNNQELVSKLDFEMFETITTEIIITIFNSLSEGFKSELFELVMLSERFNKKEYIELLKNTKATIKNKILSNALKKGYLELIKDNLNYEEIDINILMKYYKKVGIDYNIDKLSLMNIYNDNLLRIYSTINYIKVSKNLFTYLDDGFKSVVSSLDKELRSLNNVKNGDIYKDAFVRFLVGKLIDSSLKVLFDKSESISIKYARKYIGNTIYGIADIICLKIIKKFGNRSDIRILKERLNNSIHTKERVICTEGILRIAPTQNNIIMLVNTGDREVIKKCLDSFVSLSNRIRKKEIISMLNSENSSVRFCALNFIIKNNYDLEEVMRDYMKKRYYYNPVVIMDTILYAPSKIKNEMMRSLKNIENSI